MQRMTTGMWDLRHTITNAIILEAEHCCPITTANADSDSHAWLQGCLKASALSSDLGLTAPPPAKK